MEKKSKKELILIIEEQDKSLTKYKSRLHDVVESYKHLVKEKEALETSIKSITDVEKVIPVANEGALTTVENDNSDAIVSEKVNDDCLQKLKSSLGALTVEKSRVENELRTDRRKLLLEKEELERSLIEAENKWFLEKEMYETLIQELKKKISSQQREREKEQQDHALMLKELQNLVAVERANKEKFEEQVSELQHKINSKLPEKKALDYEKYIEELQSKLKVANNRWQTAENLSKNQLVILKRLQEEMDDIKLQYQKKVVDEAKRTYETEEKLKLLILVKEKRIANLESRISELSDMIGNYDKTKQQDLITIQKLKDKINHLLAENCSVNKLTSEDNKFWEYKQSNLDDENIQKLDLKNIPHLQETSSKNLISSDDDSNIEPRDNVHITCYAEILQLKEEIEMLKSKAENAAKEKYSKTSAALLSDAKTGKEIKELKSKISQLQDMLQASKSQIKLNEEYHNKITANLEKAIVELKALHKQEVAQLTVAHQAKLLEFEHQIQKQRERTLSLLEEKDKEIGLLKSTFLSSIIKKDKLPVNSSPEHKHSASDQDAAATILSNSLISSQKDGHILHYLQELARKDVEISNLRQARLQSESALRKLQQLSLLTEERRTEEIESLKSKIKLLESSKDENGTNVEYLKNVVLRFLKCNEPSSQRHMVNAIATVLHFTNSEVQEVKTFLKA